MFGLDESNRQVLFGPNRGQARLVFGHVGPNRGQARARGSQELVEGKGKGKPGLAEGSRTGGAETTRPIRGAGEGRWGPRGAGGAGARGGEPVPMGLEQSGPGRGVGGRNWIVKAAKGGGRNWLKDYMTG